MVSNPLRLAILVLALSLVTHAFGQQARRESPLLQAQAALDANDPRHAVEILTPYLKTYPTDESARLLLAEAFVMSGQPKQGEEQYQRILERSPANYLALAGLGELYISEEELQKAEPLLAKAVRNSQHEPQLRIEWAQVLVRLHRFKEASIAIANVTAPGTGSDRISFYRLKAAIDAGTGNSSAAASQMERALAGQPDDANLQLATAAAQLQAGYLPRAGKLAAAAYNQTHAPEAGILLLQAQFASHSDIHATLSSLRSLSLPPEQELALHQHLAQLLVAHDDFADAAIDLARAAELDPTNSDLRYNLALAQFKSGSTKEALASAQKAKEIGDSADIEGLLGDIQENVGDSLAAIKSYQAAVALDPKSENHQLSLALEFIRHRNFEPAKLVLKQAEKSFPNSWRVQVALGMVEYFVGTKPAASQILLHAADLAPDPELAFRYLGDIELDESAAPDPAAVTRLCGYADAHPKAAREQLYCGALALHTDYALRDKSHINEIIRRLTIASKALPDEAAPHCELGRAYSWLEDWVAAQEQSEICVKLNPNSAQAHYRLSQIYHHTGQTDRAREEIKLYKEASEKLAEENEQHERTLNTFLYTIQNQPAGPK